MIKELITAIYLSQAPIQSVPAITMGANQLGVTYVNLYPRWINTYHIHRPTDRPTVVDSKVFETGAPPTPYWFFWTCQFAGQTAQQCVAIHSMLDEELRK